MNIRKEEKDESPKRCSKLVRLAYRLFFQEKRSLIVREHLKRYDESFSLPYNQKSINVSIINLGQVSALVQSQWAELSVKDVEKYKTRAIVEIKRRNVSGGKRIRHGMDDVKGFPLEALNFLTSFPHDLMPEDPAVASASSPIHFGSILLDDLNAENHLGHDVSNDETSIKTVDISVPHHDPDPQVSNPEMLACQNEKVLKHGHVKNQHALNPSSTDPAHAHSNQDVFLAKQIPTKVQRPIPLRPYPNHFVNANDSPANFKSQHDHLVHHRPVGFANMHGYQVPSVSFHRYPFIQHPNHPPYAPYVVSPFDPSSSSAHLYDDNAPHLAVMFQSMEHSPSTTGKKKRKTFSGK